MSQLANIGNISAAGVEVDIHGLEKPGRNIKRLREICDHVGLEISTMSVPFAANWL